MNKGIATAIFMSAAIGAEVLFHPMANLFASIDFLQIQYTPLFIGVPVVSGALMILRALKP